MSKSNGYKILKIRSRNHYQILYSQSSLGVGISWRWSRGNIFYVDAPIWYLIHCDDLLEIECHFISLTRNHESVTRISILIGWILIRFNVKLKSLSSNFLAWQSVVLRTDSDQKNKGDATVTKSSVIQISFPRLADIVFARMRTMFFDVFFRVARILNRYDIQKVRRLTMKRYLRICFTCLKLENLHDSVLLTGWERKTSSIPNIRAARLRYINETVCCHQSESK